jgi:diadenosine tetraphosphate (Ap4A) HIT family hydrolase
MKDWKKDRIGSAERGQNPLVLCKMRSGYAVIGDTQFLPGYCVLLASPRVDQLHELDNRSRTIFLEDMGLLGEAIQMVCKPRRINYSILGNTDPFLHAHVFPRYDWEPQDIQPYPVWTYPKEKWIDSKYGYSNDNHGELKMELQIKLLELLEEKKNELRQSSAFLT